MKSTLIIIFTLITATVFAQTDSVTVLNGKTNSEVFYDLKLGTKTDADATTWHLGLTLGAMDASILTNEAVGVKAYVYGTDTSAWDAVDTTGMTWTRLFNSESSWNQGALANQGTFHPDYGWGSYDMSDHSINGKQIIIVEYDGTYKQVVIETMSAAGEFSIRVGDIGGANAVRYTFTKNTITDKNFGYLNLDDGVVHDLEPLKTDWDLLFTKYFTEVPTGPGTTDVYSVTGVKINKGWEVAQRDGIDVTSNDTNGLAWSTNITEIGYDWKTFNNATFKYELQENRAYFLRQVDGAEIWKLDFTYFGMGKSVFNKTALRGSVGVEEVKNSISVYPNPTQERFTISNLESNTLHIQVISASGINVLKTQIQPNNVKVYSSADWVKGVYFIQTSIEGKTSTQKLVVN